MGKRREQMSKKRQGGGWDGGDVLGEDVEVCDLGGGVRVPMREGGVEVDALLGAALEARGVLFRPLPSEARRAWRSRLEEMSPPEGGACELPPCEVEPSTLPSGARKRSAKRQKGRVGVWVARFFLWGLSCEQASRALGFRGDALGKMLPPQEAYTVLMAEPGEVLVRCKLGAVVGVLRGKRARWVLLASDAPASMDAPAGVDVPA